MKARTISLMTSLDPSVERAKSANAGLSENELQVFGQRAFRNLYGNLAVAWQFAMTWATSKRPMPLPMMGKDRWVFQAYMMLRDQRAYYDHDIATAYNFHNPPHGMTSIRAALNAAILTYHDGMDHAYHLKRVANHLHLPVRAVAAYESLFFNVLDRRLDSQCVAAVLYPNTRLEELSEDYLRTAPQSQIIMRAGLNSRDLGLVTYLAGVGDRKYMAKLAATEDGESRLTRQIIGNGLLLSALNLLNQRSAGWSRATMLMSAARQGGGKTDDPPMTDIGDYLKDEITKAAHLSQAFSTDRIIRESARSIVDVTVEPA